MKHKDTIVIGGGQAGLAAGYFLQRHGVDFAILDAAPAVGDAWRARWDSLRLFTPAEHDGLPGAPFEAPRGSFPTKDEMAAYLAAYAARHALPVWCGRRVTRLTRDDDGAFCVQTDGDAWSAARVIVATGSSPQPWVPAFAARLAPELQQLHGAAYRQPAQVAAGKVLVVGGGTSGVEIALDLAGTHEVLLSGALTFQLPKPLLRYAGGLWWWITQNVLTTRTPMGKKARRSILAGHGAPLIRAGKQELLAAGVACVPRVAGESAGKPLLEDGRVLDDVNAVVWATGYRPDFSWIDVGVPVTDDNGWLANDRGVSTAVDGLYCVGLPFQSSLSSVFVGGVGRDAELVVRALLGAARGSQPRRERAARVTASAG